MKPQPRRRNLPPRSSSEPRIFEDPTLSSKSSKNGTTRIANLVKLLLMSIALQWVVYEYSDYANLFQNNASAPLSNSSNVSESQAPSSFIESSAAPFQIGACTNLSWWYNSPQQHSTATMSNQTAATHKPVWVASFPGSGAEMFRLLVESITGGIPGWSIYDTDHPTNYTCLQVRAATCKTHWPVLPKSPPTQHVQDYHGQAMILLRNPLKAFPSRLNHQWELAHQQGYHTRQAPERAWNRWILRSLKDQLAKYKDFVLTWKNLTLPSAVLFVPYEGLTNLAKGARWTQSVATVLKGANVRVAKDEQSVSCLWRFSIWEKPKMKRANHTYVPGYTAKQRGKLVQMMEELVRETRNRPDLQMILKSYLETIVDQARIIVIPAGKKQQAENT